MTGTQKPTRILHLSDFHFSSKTKWDATRLLKSLPKAISDFASEDLSPDLVVITGDVARTGQKKEYEQARKWIEEELLEKALPGGFSKSRILIVPGNHDVDRSTVKRAAQAMQDALLDKPSQSKVAEVMEDSADRGVLLKRHAAFLRFANGFRPPEQRLKVPWWSDVFDLNGSRLHVAGLCSSWMSWGDEDKGKLLVGRWQVNTLFKDAPDDADFRIVLLHHPWSYLADFDAADISDTVHREADLVLRGHLHAQRSIGHYDPDNASLELAAGCVYDGSDYANAFQLIELFPGERKVRVHYRTWRSGEWLPDRHAYKSTPEGIAEFSLATPSAAPTPAAVTSAPADPTTYLQNLRDQNQYIDIRGLQVGSGKAYRFPIDKLYIPLTTTGGAKDLAEKRSRKDRLPEMEPDRGEPVDLRDCLKHRCLVVLGDPGAGKTTFLRRIVFELSRRQLGRASAKGEGAWDTLGEAYPILIPLHALAQHRTAARERKVGPMGDDSGEWIVHFAATRSKEAGEGLGEGSFRSLLQEGRAIVLLDALDEVPTQKERLALRKLIEKAAHDNGGCRFIVTTRPAAFVGEVVLADFEQARIAPLEDAAIETFLDRWCHQIWPDSETEAQKHLGELLLSLKGRPEIRRMARNPVMLTALAVVHWNEKRLPEQRADLYESIIGWLARRRLLSEGRPKPEQCIVLLQNLALGMQDHPKGRQTQITRHAGARAIASSFREVAEDEQVGAAETFLAKEEVDSGIVVGRGEHDIRFWHLTFQEYLAARALAARSEKVQAETLLGTDKLYAQEWREVVLLLAGVLHGQGIERVDSMFEAVLDEVGPKARLKTKARCAGLLSAVLRDLAPVGYRPAHKRYAQIVRDALAVFNAKSSKRIPIEVAIEAAEAIAQGGDPRFADPKSEENWVTIPAGEFLMGVQKDDPAKPNYDADVWGGESPVHPVRLSAYRIGKYPVTVGEYRGFVDDGGYTKEQYWENGGYGKWQEPEDWGEQLAHLTRPVVNVSWYEAAAYAVWAECRLPTEAEWERAARGTDARRYPWGDEKPDPSLCSFGGNVGHATPVGVYPLGASADGALDMAGNVWEWCWDWYADYSTATRRDPRGPSSGKYRVLRGGSWVSSAGGLRCAVRFYSDPGDRNHGIGFRLALDFQ